MTNSKTRWANQVHEKMCSFLFRYFFAAVFQFQLHRSMCIASGEFDPTNPSKPLHKCSIYRHPEAGDILKFVALRISLKMNELILILFRKLMSKGSSQPWLQTMQEVIGEGRLDGSALREYFKPLEEWLRNENLRNQEYVGWNYDGDYCKKRWEVNKDNPWKIIEIDFLSIETANLQVFGGFYNSSPHASINLKVFIVSAILSLNFLIF